MKTVLILLLIFSNTPLFASTFVGNGGNAGDIERTVTIHQIKGALKVLSKSTGNVCTCDSTYSNSDICEGFKSLNETQQNFCSQLVRQLSLGLSQQLDANQIQFSWTQENIQVQEENSLRAVDAVTDPVAKKVTVNLNQFLNMNESQRVFLVGHEMFHLASYNKASITDKDPIGPMKTPEGQRSLVNSMGASIVMAAYHEGLFKKYQATLDRPASWKSHYIEAAISGMNLGEQKNTKSVYYNDEFSGGKIGYRYQTQSPFGVIAQLEHYENEKTILTSIKAKEELSGGSFGVSYRFFPFKDPLTFLGQSHFIFDVQVEYFKTKYALNDPYVGTDAESSSLGPSLNCNYYIPLELKFWLFVGLGVSYHNYEYKTLGLKYETIRTNAVIGASYGF
ncbi:MAG: hypothetical protein KDD34_08560 [Bdellovibrionales bacterium]|nr:hypothetical protein [Bdellovibrionales bacterium]